MRSYRFLTSAAAAMLSAGILLSLSSCVPDTGDTPATSPTPVLFALDDATTAIHSGNLLYGSFLTSDGKYIYFRSKDGKSLVRSNYDGSEPITLTSRVPFCINTANNQVFFIEGTESGPIYKIDNDGKGETMITDDVASSVIVTKSVLYYIRSADSQVYRLLHDGSQKTVVFPGKAARIMFIGNTLYIQPAAPDTGIYGISEAMLLAASPENPLVIKDLQVDKVGIYPTSLNIDGGLLYFTDEIFSRIFYMNSKNRLKEFYKNAVGRPFIINSGFLYYTDIDDSNRLYRMRLSNPADVRMVVNDGVDQFVILGNSIYYKRIDGNDIFRTSVGGGQSQKVT